MCPLSFLSVEAEGFFKPNMTHVVYRVAEIILMHVAGFYCLFNGHMAVGLVLLGTPDSSKQARNHARLLTCRFDFQASFPAVAAG